MIRTALTLAIAAVVLAACNGASNDSTRDRLSAATTVEDVAGK